MVKVLKLKIIFKNFEKRILIYTNMKWILPRDKFINEAKLRDVLSKPQKEVLLRVWGEKYLDYEEVTPTNRIKQGKWKLTEEDKDAVINRFFKTNYSWVREVLANLPDKFSEVLSQSLSISDNKNLDSYQRERVGQGFKEGFDIKKLKIIQIACLNYPIFKQLNSSETKSDTKVLKDENGSPVRDDKDNIIKVPKEPGEPSFSSNISNLNTFITGFNSSYPDSRVDGSIFLNSNIQNITNMIDDNPDIIDFDLFGDHEMYLLIEHNAVNIMNMSVSKFYKSCQELYFGGGHGEQYMRGLLANVFDPNTIPAFLIFDTPYYGISKSGGDPEKLSDVLPLCRLLIRSIEPFSETDSETKLYFDKTYPDRMKDILQKMIEKYSGNEPADYDYIRKYPFAPDVQIKDWEETLGDPYMDNLDIVKGTRIGKNTKSLYISGNYDWSNVIIDKDINIKELIIETPNIPNNFFDIKFKPDWIKFKYITINDFSVFSNILTDSISLYQCKLNRNFLDDLYKVSPGLKCLSLGGVDVDDLSKLSMFSNLEDLELLYTISSKEKLEDLIGKLNLKKLSISGDLIKNKENKEYIERLKKDGVSVKLKGLVL